MVIVFIPFLILYFVDNQDEGIEVNTDHEDSLSDDKPMKSSLEVTTLITETKATNVSHSDLDRQIAQLRKCETISENEVKNLCSKAREILIEESNVQRVDAPVTVSFVGLKCQTIGTNVNMFLNRK